MVKHTGTNSSACTHSTDPSAGPSWTTGLPVPDSSDWRQAARSCHAAAVPDAQRTIAAGSREQRARAGRLLAHREDVAGLPALRHRACSAKQTSPLCVSRLHRLGVCNSLGLYSAAGRGPGGCGRTKKFMACPPVLQHRPIYTISMPHLRSLFLSASTFALATSFHAMLQAHMHLHTKGMRKRIHAWQSS